MRLLRVVNAHRNRELGNRIGLADRWLLRLRGMLGRPVPSLGEGLLLTPCRSIHMIGMRCPLDVAFLDGSGAVLATHRSISPGWRARGHPKAIHTLELAAGALEESGTTVGDVLVWSALDEEQRVGANS
jgi:uncharacterized protein